MYAFIRSVLLKCRSSAMRHHRFAQLAPERLA